MSKTASALRDLPKRGEIKSSISQFANNNGEFCGVDASGHVHIAGARATG